MNQSGDELQWQAERQGVYIAYAGIGRYMIITKRVRGKEGPTLHWIPSMPEIKVVNLGRCARVGTLMRIAEIDAVTRA